MSRRSFLSIILSLLELATFCLGGAVKPPLTSLGGGSRARTLATSPIIVVAHWVPKKMTPVTGIDYISGTTEIVIDRVLKGKITGKSMRISVQSSEEPFRVLRSNMNEWGLGRFPGEVDDLRLPSIWFLSHTVPYGGRPPAPVPDEVLPVSDEAFYKILLGKSPDQAIGRYLSKCKGKDALLPLQYIAETDSADAQHPFASVKLKQYSGAVERACSMADPEVRRFAVFTLYLTRGLSCTPKLLLMQRDKNPEVRSMASALLLQSLSAKVLKAAAQRFSIGDRECDAVDQFLRRASAPIQVDILLACLEDDRRSSNGTICYDAQQALTRTTGYEFPYSVSQGRALWSRVERLPSRGKRLKELNRLREPVKARWQARVSIVNGVLTLDLTNKARVPVTLSGQVDVSASGHGGSMSGGTDSGGRLVVKPGKTIRIQDDSSEEFSETWTQAAFGFWSLPKNVKNPWLGKFEFPITASTPRSGKWLGYYHYSEPKHLPKPIAMLNRCRIPVIGYRISGSDYDLKAGVFFNDAKGVLSATSIETGKAVWTVKHGVQASGAPMGYLLCDSALVTWDSFERIDGRSRSTGQVVWHITASDCHGIDVDGDTIFLTYKNGTEAIDASNGKKLWVCNVRAPKAQQAWSSPGWPLLGISPKYVVMTCSNPCWLLLIDRKTGSPLWSKTWSLPYPGVGDCAVPTILGGYLYADLPPAHCWTPYSGVRMHENKLNLAKIRLSDGKVLWQRPELASAWKRTLARRVLATNLNTGGVVAIDADTGKTLWQKGYNLVTSYRGMLIRYDDTPTMTYYAAIDPLTKKEAWRMVFNRNMEAWPDDIDQDGYLHIREDDDLWMVKVPR